MTLKAHLLTPTQVRGSPCNSSNLLAEAREQARGHAVPQGRCEISLIVYMYDRD